MQEREAKTHTTRKIVAALSLLTFFSSRLTQAIPSGTQTPSKQIFSPWPDSSVTLRLPLLPCVMFQAPTVHPINLIVEGGKMTVLCIAMGSPPPTVSLYISGVLINQVRQRRPF